LHLCGSEGDDGPEELDPIEEEGEIWCAGRSIDSCSLYLHIKSEFLKVNEWQGATYLGAEVT
jgi:hypothetical protein